MPTEHQASRTLVKSPPELWAECSDAGSLARHIGEFGEIRITRLEPETSVCWEAEHASGTVAIEPSGWGTRVTLTAQTAATGVVIESAEPPAGETEPAEPPAAEIEPAEPSGAEANPVEEESDAKVEETVAKSDLAVADPPTARGRWRRMIARTRSWFSPATDRSDPLPEKHDDPVVVPEAQVAPGPPEPPLATREAPAEPAEDAGAAESQLGPVSAEDAQPPAESPPAAIEDEPALNPEAILASALDSLGQAHHRPFSRA